MKDINFEAFREYLLDNPDYTTEDMELICQACSDWDNNRDEFYKERPEFKKPKETAQDTDLIEACNSAIDLIDGLENFNIEAGEVLEELKAAVKKAEGARLRR